MWSRWAALPGSTLVPFVDPAIEAQKIDTQTHTHTHTCVQTHKMARKQRVHICMNSICGVNAAAAMLSSPAGSVTCLMLQQQGL